MSGPQCEAPFGSIRKEHRYACSSTRTIFSQLVHLPCEFMPVHSYLKLSCGCTQRECNLHKDQCTTALQCVFCECYILSNSLSAIIRHNINSCIFLIILYLLLFNLSFVLVHLVFLYRMSTNACVRIIRVT